MTNKEKSGQGKLMEAMRLSEFSYCEKFTRVDGEIHYSEEYLRDMEKLIKKSRNPIRKYFDTVGKRVAAAVIAAVALSGSMMSVSAVREPVVEFFTNIYEKFVEIFFDKDVIANAPNTIEIVYTLGMIPDGYKVDQFVINNTSTSMTWKNEYENIIVFSQGVLLGSSIMDIEDLDYIIFYIGHTKVAYNEKYGVKTYFWNNEKYAFSLTVTDEIPHDKCVELIESLTTYND